MINITYYQTLTVDDLRSCFVFRRRVDDTRYILFFGWQLSFAFLIPETQCIAAQRATDGGQRQNPQGHELGQD